jgi:predicted dehydrogenase
MPPQSARKTYSFSRCGVQRKLSEHYHLRFGLNAQYRGLSQDSLRQMASNRSKITMGLVGPGFVAPHHLDAVRRLGNVKIVGLAASSLERARAKAAELGVPKAYGNYEELLADPDIQVVHNTTPNYLHLPVNLAALNRGKHIISDKPLAPTADECSQLTAAASRAARVNAVTFNHRGYPLVQQMRSMIAGGEIGMPVFVHGSYLQDWMTSDRVYSWRMDSALGGPSSALADIGSHWCDLAQHIVGSPITAVFADLTTVVRTRYTTGVSAEAFSNASDNASLRAIPMAAEDLGTVLLRFANGAHGVMSVGQVLPGHKNELKLEVNGRTGSLAWDAERANELWIGRHNQPNQCLAKDPSLMHPSARPYAHLPGGHQEAWADAFRNVIADIYSWIDAGTPQPHAQSTVATFADATRIAALIEAMLTSNRTMTWQTVPDRSQP